MNSSRRKLAAFLEALGVPPSARRPHATPAAPACESLEGRQLLAGGMGFDAMSMGAPADVSGAGYRADSTGMMDRSWGRHSDVDSGGDTTHGFGGDSGRMDGRSSDMAGRSGSSFSSSVPDANSGTGSDLGLMDARSSVMSDRAAASTSSGVTDATSFGGRGDFGRMDGRSSDMAPDLTGMGGQSGVSSASSTVADAPTYLESQDAGVGLAGFAGGRRGAGGGFGGGGGFVGHDMTLTNSGTTTDDSQVQTDIQKLQTDDQAIHDKSQVTPAMQATVRKDINAIKGAETTTADSTALTTLQTDLKTAMTSVGGPTTAQLAQVQTDQDAVYKSEGVNASLVTKLDTDLAAIQTASGITDTDRSTITSDQAAIKADLTPTTPPTTTPSSTTATTASPMTPASTPSTTTTSSTSSS